MSTNRPRRRAFVFLLASSAALSSALLSATGCAPGQRAGAARAEPESAVGSVGLLKTWMLGAFSSVRQSQEDPSFFNVHLHMVEVWPARADGPWIYVEQAMSDALDKPYRQRVYRLSALGGGLYESAVYELADSPEQAQAFAGAWKSDKPLAELSPDALKRKDGCEVVLRYFPELNAFKGGTLAANCPSSLRGAAYATSQITLTPTMLESWDRGYDASGKQVWGAVKGPYRFER